MSIDNTERTNEPSTEPTPETIVLSVRGVSKRYVPIPTVAAARSPAIAALIEAAAAVIHGER